jgi:hypothetical protein
MVSIHFVLKHSFAVIIKMIAPNYSGAFAFFLVVFHLCFVFVSVQIL